jgi:hypothetical protein
LPAPDLIHQNAKNPANLSPARRQLVAQGKEAALTPPAFRSKIMRSFHENDTEACHLASTDCRYMASPFFTTFSSTW